jgi:uncharacterized protein (TIGR02300 family)
LPKPEWGTKRLCASCGAKFYDFNRTEITCPACGAAWDPEAVTRIRRPPRSEPVAEKAPKARAVEEGEEEVDLGLGEEEALGDGEEIADDEKAAEPGVEEEVEEIEEEIVEDEVIGVEADEDEEDAAIIEDADELGDEEDVEEVVEVDSDEEDDR